MSVDCGRWLLCTRQNRQCAQFTLRPACAPYLSLYKHVSCDASESRHAFVICARPARPSVRPTCTAYHGAGVRRARTGSACVTKCVAYARRDVVLAVDGVVGARVARALTLTKLVRRAVCASAIARLSIFSGCSCVKFEFYYNPSCQTE